MDVNPLIGKLAKVRSQLRMLLAGSSLFRFGSSWLVESVPPPLNSAALTCAPTFAHAGRGCAPTASSRALLARWGGTLADSLGGAVAGGAATAEAAVRFAMNEAAFMGVEKNG